MYDIRKLLKRYGVFIYTGDRLGDLDLMEGEIRDLYDAKIVDLLTFQQAILILKKEKADLSS